jgi:uncharacterized MAPEG superfamily protein
MFCPSCGAESTIELNYCNRCGANLSSGLNASAEIAPINLTKPILIIAATVLMLTLGGFAGVISGTIAMVRAGAGEVSPAIPFFGIPSLLTIDILLLRQLSKLISAALAQNRLPYRKTSAQPQNELRFPRPTTARLEPAPSVTENTTRFFEPAYREPVPRDKIEK